jgi:small subunit ribosomal protein S17
MEENSVVEETPSEVATPVAAAPVAQAPAAETPAMAASAEANEVGRGRRKERIGKVVSDKMDKTIVVTLTRQVPHPLYKKYFKKTTKFVAHNENNDAKMGDTVRIMETRPLSRTKRWRVVEVLERAK